LDYYEAVKSREYCSHKP